MAESVREFFEQAEGRLDPARTAGQEASYRFDVEEAGSWHVDIKDGEANPMTAYMTGKLKVEGNLGLAIKLKEFFF